MSLVVAGLADLAMVVFTIWCLQRSRRTGASLRLRIFAAVALAALFGALATGLYAVVVDQAALGFQARLTRVLPKAFLLGSVLVPFSAAVAAALGSRLSRSVEQLVEAASRIAGGERTLHLPHGSGGEALELSRALASIRCELETKPYAAAFLRDAWHDLKTPVAALRASLEILEDPELAPATARHFLDNMRRSTEQLDRRLVDLITLARYETASLAPERASTMSAVMTRAISRVSIRMHPSVETSKKISRAIKVPGSALV